MCKRQGLLSCTRRTEKISPCLNTVHVKEVMEIENGGGGGGGLSPPSLPIAYTHEVQKLTKSNCVGGEVIPTRFSINYGI